MPRLHLESNNPYFNSQVTNKKLKSATSQQTQGEGEYQQLSLPQSSFFLQLLVVIVQFIIAYLCVWFVDEFDPIEIQTLPNSQLLYNAQDKYVAEEMAKW